MAFVGVLSPFHPFGRWENFPQLCDLKIQAFPPGATLDEDVDAWHQLLTKLQQVALVEDVWIFAEKRWDRGEKMK